MKLGDSHKLAPTLRWELHDGTEDDKAEVFRCPCGVTYTAGCYWVAHQFKACDR